MICGKCGKERKLGISENNCKCLSDGTFMPLPKDKITLEQVIEKYYQCVLNYDSLLDNYKKVIDECYNLKTEYQKLKDDYLSISQTKIMQNDVEVPEI